MVGQGSRRRRRAAAVVLGLATLVLAGCDRTSISGLQVHSRPDTSSAVNSVLVRDGTSVRISCWTRGEAIYGHDVWYRITRPTPGYVTSYYVDTGSSGAMQRNPSC